MDRRVLIASGLSLIVAAKTSEAFAQGGGPNYPVDSKADTYSRDELVNKVSDFFGVGAEAAGAVIAKAFKDNGQPTGYIAGEEGAAAITVGLRYGKGLLYMKNREPVTVYWQGPSVGFDLGANASRCFTLCYDLQRSDQLFQRLLVARKLHPHVLPEQLRILGERRAGAHHQPACEAHIEVEALVQIGRRIG